MTKNQNQTASKINLEDKLRTSELALKESEENYKAIFENTQFSIFIINLEGKILLVNETAAKFFGKQKEDYYGQSIFKFQPKFKTNFPIVLQMLDQNNGKVEREEHFTISGQERWLFVTISYIILKEEKSIQIIMQDITDKKIAEKKLKESEARYRLISENSKEVIYNLDLQLNYTFISDSIYDSLGYLPEDFINGKVDIFKIFTPKSIDLVLETFKKEFELEKNPNSDKNRIHTIILENIHKNGNIIYTEENVTFNRDEEGNAIGIVGIARDVTEREAIKMKLQESEKQYRTLIEQSLIGVAIFNEKHFLFSNQRLSDILEINKSEIDKWTREDYLNLIHPGLMQVIGEKLENLDSIERKDYKIHTRFGKKKWVRQFLAVIQHEGEKAYQLNLIDITEEKRTEEERIKAQKLESIGLLAGGIAHDYNNILVGILGNIEILQLEKPSPDQLEIILDLRQAALRAKDLSKQLLTFSMGGIPNKRDLNIVDIIKDSASLVFRGSNCKLIFNPPTNLPKTIGDIGQLNQVLNNLFINAIQATPKGGFISCELTEVYVQNEYPVPVKDGKYIKIEIIDEGEGIPKDDQINIFSPYFTTKSKGTGLGLTTCYSIIKQHGGYITFNSKVGVGTTFIIYIPILKTNEKLLAPDEQKDLPEGLNILFMDDDKQIHDVIERYAKQCGYSCTATFEGNETIQVYQNGFNNNKKFDIVVLDLTVSAGVGGEETLKRLQQFDPDVKIIISSGYSSGGRSFLSTNGKSIVSLNKPYTFNEFCKAIKSTTYCN